jgi:hypothetical protein
MMKRDECFRILARHIGDAAVVATYSSAVDWVAVAPRVLNYTSIGAMGLDSSHGLGLALGRPDKRVIVAAGRRFAAHEPRESRHHCRGGAEESRASYRPQRDLRGQWRPSYPQSKSGFRRTGARRRLCRGLRFRRSRRIHAAGANVLEQDGPVFATLHVESSARR